MKSKSMLTIASAAVALVVLGGAGVTSSDKNSVKVPGGLSFSEFRGYEGWETVAVSHPKDSQLLNVIVANPVMIEAFRSGIPVSGKSFPNGAKMAKISWSPRQHPEAPFSVKVPDNLAGIGFMVKDSARFPESGGWGYAQFDYVPSSDNFTPNTSLQANDAKCGAACHTIAKSKDFVFTNYAKR